MVPPDDDTHGRVSSEGQIAEHGYAGKGRFNAYVGTARLVHWTIAALVDIQYATRPVPVDALGVFTEDGLTSSMSGRSPHEVGSKLGSALGDRG